MSRFIRTSAHSYYNYLQKYKSPTILKYQANQYFNMGRKSAWQNLVYKYAGDHLTTEDDFNNHYKTPILLYNISNRMGTLMFIYIFYIMLTALSISEQQRVYLDIGEDYDDQPMPATQRSFGYEFLYNERKPQVA